MYTKIGVRQELKICPICKLETLMKFNQKVCPGCAVENNRQLQREWRKLRGVKRKAATIIKPSSTEWRELTNLTEKLICVYTHIGGERNTIKQIAEDLSRPVEQVKSILSEAVKSGRYEKYAVQFKKYKEDGKG